MSTIEIIREPADGIPPLGTEPRLGDYPRQDLSNRGMQDWVAEDASVDTPGDKDEPHEQDLQWRDLSADEVYHIAWLENEARDATARYIIKAATSDSDEEGIAGAFHRYSVIDANRDRYIGLIANAEARAEDWFEDQVQLRRGELPPPPPGDLKTWLQRQLEHNAVAGLRKQDIAERIGFNFSSFSTYCHDEDRGGRISRRNLTRLAVGFADLRGLEGEEREAFIAAALRIREQRRS